MRVLLTMSYNNIIVLNIIPALYEGYIVSVHRMVHNIIWKIVLLTLAASRGGITDLSIYIPGTWYPS